MSTVNEIALFATNAHSGQTRRGGQQYIMHPLRVSQRCKTIDQKIVALLHDVIEDTDMGLYDLPEMNSSCRNAVIAITKEPRQSYYEYIKEVLGNELATYVKTRDICDNFWGSNLKKKPKYILALMALITIPWLRKHIEKFKIGLMILAAILFSISLVYGLSLTLKTNDTITQTDTTSEGITPE